MRDPATLVAVLAAAVVALAMLSLAALKGWDGWLQLRRHELDRSAQRRTPPAGAAGAELAELKERVRRLEAIANGAED
jgi:hypothetical protein